MNSVVKSKNSHDQIHPTTRALVVLRLARPATAPTPKCRKKNADTSSQHTSTHTERSATTQPPAGDAGHTAHTAERGSNGSARLAWSVLNSNWRPISKAATAAAQPSGPLAPQARCSGGWLCGWAPEPGCCGRAGAWLSAAPAQHAPSTALPSPPKQHGPQHRGHSARPAWKLQQGRTHFFL